MRGFQRVHRMAACALWCGLQDTRRRLETEHKIVCRVIVQQLRIHKTVEPEYFTSVSIFFSELEGYVTWIMSVGPRTAISTLNTLFTAFDNEISNFSVYKVETIRDSYVVSFEEFLIW